MFGTKVRTVRILTISIVIMVIVLGVACKIGFGTICSLGSSAISYTCPLGYLQTVLAGRTLLPQLWLSITLVLLSVVVLGRFFCAWICPMALLRDIFKGKGVNSARETRELKAHVAIEPRASSFSDPNGSIEVQPKKPPWAFDSRHAVLGGALLSSFLFGFPVFCLVCPIGLFFGSLFAVSRLFSAKQPSLELLLFPVLLGLELFALKSWCRSICPLGALLSLASSHNRFLRPVIKKEICLVSKGIDCQACGNACPEGINLRNQKGILSLKDCTKCLECSHSCPVRAIHFPLRA